MSAVGSVGLLAYLTTLVLLVLLDAGLVPAAGGIAGFNTAWFLAAAAFLTHQASRLGMGSEVGLGGYRGKPTRRRVKRLCIG